MNNELVTRSGRVSCPPTRFDDYQMHLQTQAHPSESTCEYAKEEARVIAKIMEHLETKVNNMEERTYTQLAQTYSLRAALKKLKDKGKEATMGEMKQLDDRNVYYPIKVEELTPKERKRAMERLLFIVEKRDGRVKARFWCSQKRDLLRRCHDSFTQRRCVLFHEFCKRLGRVSELAPHIRESRETEAKS